jgi:hypothetical protein
MKDIKKDIQTKRERRSKIKKYCTMKLSKEKLNLIVNIGCCTLQDLTVKLNRLI